THLHTALRWGLRQSCDGPRRQCFLAAVADLPLQTRCLLYFSVIAFFCPVPIAERRSSWISRAIEVGAANLRFYPTNFRVGFCDRALRACSSHGCTAATRSSMTKDLLFCRGLVCHRCLPR